LDHMRIVPDHRIAGMVTSALDEILLTTLIGVVCEANDWEEIEEVATRALDWLRAFLPFENGIATAQRKGFHPLDPLALEQGFAAKASLSATHRDIKLKEFRPKRRLLCFLECHERRTGTVGSDNYGCFDIPSPKQQK